MSLRDLTIRKFRTEDAKAVARIISAGLKIQDEQSNNEITPKYVLTLSNKLKLYVALADTKVIGTAGIDHDRISTVFVDKEYSGKGTLEELLNLLEEIASNNGIQHIELEAGIDAQRIYQRVGYTATEEALESELGSFILMEKYLT